MEEPSLAMNKTSGKCTPSPSRKSGTPDSPLALLVIDDRGQAQKLCKALLNKDLKYIILPDGESLLVRLASETFAAVIIVGMDALTSPGELLAALKRYYPMMPVAQLITTSPPGSPGESQAPQLRVIHRAGSPSKIESPQNARTTQPDKVQQEKIADEPPTKEPATLETDDTKHPDESGPLTHDELAMLLDGEWE